jgi:hypothetical protein
VEEAQFEREDPAAAESALFCGHLADLFEEESVSVLVLCRCQPM